MSTALFLLLAFTCTFAIVQRPLPTPSYKTLDQDNTIYIGTAQVVTNGPAFTPSIYISNMLWQDKINARGGIRVNGTNYNVSVVFVDIGDPAGFQTDAVIIPKLQALWRQFVDVTGPYGRIDFLVSPWSTAYTTPLAVISEPYKIVTVSGIHFF